MSGPALQPWSVEDAPEENSGSQEAAAAASGTQGAPMEIATADAPRAAHGGVLDPRWALWPIGAAVVLQGWSLVHHSSGGEAVLVSLMQLACGGMGSWLVWFGVTSHRRQMVTLLSAARHMTLPGGRQDAEEELAGLSPDLREFQEALMSHLRGLNEGLQRTRDEGRALGYRLASTEQRHTRAVLDGLNKAVLVFDSSERLVYANPSAGALLGFDVAASLKHSLEDVVRDAALAQHLRQAQRAPLKTRRQLEIPLGDRCFDLTLTHLADADERGSGAAGEASGGSVVAVLHDVTRERQASKVMSEFVSHVSHELRTPLSSLKAYAEMLLTGEAKDEATRREYCGIIEAETDRMSRLIDEILNISRIESGVVKVSKEPIALTLVVREVVDVMRPQAEKKRIKLIEELSPVAHEVLADRDMMKQAVLNLTSNAIKYTPEGGRVRVEMRVNEGDRRVTVEVSDTGLGIPQEDLPRVFEKFFRVKANSKIAKGTGLGLNLVKNIVETVHGGTVGARSKVGEGSRFSITLPLV